MRIASPAAKEAVLHQDTLSKSVRHTVGTFQGYTYHSENAGMACVAVKCTFDSRKYG